jgi:hypothetical protein
LIHIFGAKPAKGVGNVEGSDPLIPLAAKLLGIAVLEGKLLDW